jgi:hypothetical protein
MITVWIWVELKRLTQKMSYSPILWRGHSELEKVADGKGLNYPIA